jgi:hypothetical protein
MVPVLSLLLLPGCRKLAEKATEKVAEKVAEQQIEKSTGGKAHVDINSQGGSVKVSSDNGKTQAEYGTASLPEGWPAWLPQYPGSKITMGMRQMEGDKASLHLMLTTRDAPDKVLQFYEQKAIAQGFKSQMKMNMQQTGTMETFEGTDQTLSIVISTGSDGTSASLTLVPKSK